MTMPSVADAGNTPREENDFYPTEPEATIALVNLMRKYWDIMSRTHKFDLAFHEPACGDGAISKVLEQFGYDVLSTDLIDRGFGTPGVDYLRSGETRPIVITNPPFKYAEEFIVKANTSGARYVYMLLKSTYFHAESRRRLFSMYPPRRVMPLTWRLDFTGQGSPTMECAWFEWHVGHVGQTVYGPLLFRPDKNRCLDTMDMFE